MTKEQILATVDHTLLRADATWQDVRRLCDEAMQAHTASVCINPCFVKEASVYMEFQKDKVAVCTVVGFPLGANTTQVKVAETRQAIEDGADEVDMVINIGWVKAGRWQDLQSEIAALKAAAGNKVLKVIIETCLLTDAEKRKMCDIVCAAGADYIKTSTGFSKAGATFADIQLFHECVAGRCKIKAAGGISSIADMEQFLALGADRLGTSRAIGLFAVKE